MHKRLRVLRPIRYDADGTIPSLSMKVLKSILYSLGISALSACTTGGADFHRVAEDGSFPPDDSIAREQEASSSGHLKIVTLNIAHGRNQAASQLLLDKETIKQNLIDIASLLKNVGADVVALQEADGPSGWSGNFDHVDLLASTAGYPWHYRANHAESWLFSYGTALLSRLPVDEIIQHTFTPSPPTFNKGFLLGRIRWTVNHGADGTVPVDIVSVHLDFSSHKVRERQIHELSALLSRRNNPVIIVGDFNSDWVAQESIVKQLAENTGTSTYKPLAGNLYTYNSRHRYDWILVSSELELVSYRVLPDELSDHLAIVAEIRFKESMR